MNSEEKYQSALQLLSSGKPDSALPLLVELKETYPRQGLIFWYISIIQLQKSNFSEALQNIETALNFEPENANFFSERGVIYLHLNKLSLSLFDFDRATEIEPQNPYRYSSRAYLKERLGDIDGAIADYEMAIQLDPSDAVAHNNLGMLYEKVGWNEKAGESFKKADAKPEEDTFIEMFNQESASFVDGPEISNPAEQNTETKQTYFSIIKSVFTDSKTRNEFFGFWFGNAKK